MTQSSYLGLLRSRNDAVATCCTKAVSYSHMDVVNPGFSLAVAQTRYLSFPVLVRSFLHHSGLHIKQLRCD